MSGKGFIPPTGEVLYRWMYFEDGPYPQDQGEFDRWLASVKAEAWQQGADSAYYDPEIRDQVNYPDNPYREQEVT